MVQLSCHCRHRRIGRLLRHRSQGRGHQTRHAPPFFRSRGGATPGEVAHAKAEEEEGQLHNSCSIRLALSPNALAEVWVTLEGKARRQCESCGGLWRRRREKKRREERKKGVVKTGERK